jgi:UDP-N-acetylglucosamine--N-acetylmuramyl-(pentapeptide) pyrophosphoryl-undecaprenol N-acetylglucosamine transferase
MNIVISGGHLTPALAFIEYLQAHHPQTQVTFVGRLYSQDRLRQKSQEHEEVTRRQIPFIPLFAPRMNSNGLVDRVMYVLQLLASVFHALGILITHRPDAFLSFGSYVAVPLALASALLRIPIVTHEQTRTVGQATKLIARVAKVVAVSHASSQAQLPGRNVVVTGNPLRLQLFAAQPKPDWAPPTSEKPLLYITGGNQGSEMINLMVQQTLKSLLKHWQVVHQCGGATAKRNYIQELLKTRSHLTQVQQADYSVREWLKETELGWVYSRANVVVARSGANTVQELAALRIPSVLIPLPFAHHDEQTLNARYLAETGGAILLPQKELSPQSLVAATEKARKFSRSMKNKLKTLHVPLDADAQLYQVLANVCK